MSWIRSAWTLTILVITLSLMIFFAVVVPLVPRSQWISIALELLVLSGMLLLAINARVSAPGMPRRAYHFLSVWGISLPLLTVYLSNLAQRDPSVLVINVPILILLYAWAIWTLEVLEKRKTLGVISLVGLSLIASGVLVAAASWGWLTLGDRPMMPYPSYMLEQPLLYVGLLLISIGAILHVGEKEKEHMSRLVRILIHNFKLVVLLLLAFVLVVSIVAMYNVVMNRPPHIKLTDLHFDHQNHTYRIDQEISIWTQVSSMALKNHGAHVSATLRVYAENGTKINEDTFTSFRIFVTPARGKKIRRLNRVQKIGTAFTIRRPGEYDVEITAYDHRSGKQATTRSQISIVDMPDPNLSLLMDVKITDLQASYRLEIIDYVVPTNLSNMIYMVYLFGNAKNHGDPGWATIVGYLESDGTRLETEQRLYFNAGMSRTVYTKFEYLTPREATYPGDFQHGFQVTHQELD